ncbi:WD40 repeat domain-containing protein, partial [bacterium]|nr:WD40 repeat domain-containing protein [bacterium]
MDPRDRSSRRRRVAAALAVLVLASSSGCASQEDAVVLAWEEYHRAMLALDVPASRALLAAEHEADLDGPDAAMALQMRSALVPARPEVTGVEVSGDRAMVAVHGDVDGQPVRGRIAFAREGVAWKVARESWDVALGDAGSEVPAAFPVPDVHLAEVYAAGAEAAPQERVGIAAHDGAVTALAFTRDGSALVSIGYDDYLLCLWDTGTGGRLDAIELDERPNDLALAPDGRAAYVVGTDGRITEWAIEAGAFGEPRFLSGLAGATPRIAVGPDGHRAVTTSWNDPAKLWDLDEGTFVRSLPRSERMRGVAFSPAGPTVVCGSSGDSFVRW